MSDLPRGERFDWFWSTSNGEVVVTTYQPTTGHLRITQRDLKLMLNAVELDNRLKASGHLTETAGQESS